MTKTDKKILMIAYHYPPIQASSGVHRTLTFSRHLKKAGWFSTVLTVTRNAFIDWRKENEELIPKHVHVIRSFAIDVHRHLSIKGKYPGFLATPDRWSLWLITAVVSGFIAIKRDKPDVLFSTYPLATAHLIAYILHRLTGLQWVADFRDPMVQPGYPADLKVRRTYEWIESRVLRHASCLIFTTQGAIATYQQRYPEVPFDRYFLIENGYDEESFMEAESRTVKNKHSENAPLILLHSGLIYEVERNPSHLFSALAQLKADGIINSHSLRVVLRASGSEDMFSQMILAENIDDIVTLERSLDYKSAVVEMMNVDGLLLLQAANCNHQIPAKVYEYLRCHKPILALTDSEGDTAALLRRSGVKSIVSLDNKQEIYDLIVAFVKQGTRQEFLPTDTEFVRSMSREGRAAKFADVLDNLSQ